MKISCQEHLLPGDTLVEKFDFAAKAGWDGIELRGFGDFQFEARLPELRAAQKAGVVMPTVCVAMDHFIGDFDAEKRKDAVANLKSQLGVMAELGGRGAMTPASWASRTSSKTS
jgi:sugar phosphate isomerase/epimerase